MRCRCLALNIVNFAITCPFFSKLSLPFEKSCLNVEITSTPCLLPQILRSYLPQVGTGDQFWPPHTLRQPESQITLWIQGMQNSDYGDFHLYACEGWPRISEWTEKCGAGRGDGIWAVPSCSISMPGDSFSNSFYKKRWKKVDGSEWFCGWFRSWFRNGSYSAHLVSPKQPNCLWQLLPPRSVSVARDG